MEELGRSRTYATGRRVVVAFGEHGHAADDLCTPVLVFRQTRLALAIGQSAVNQKRVPTPAAMKASQTFSAWATVEQKMIVLRGMPPFLSVADSPCR